MPLPPRPADPIFGLPTPILFAHRGGAKEVEESTRRGFQHAVDIGTDVLELDVHVLKNGSKREFVVWHGPELSNVVLKALPGEKAYVPSLRDEDENDIRTWNWLNLKGQAWVAHPDKVNDNFAAINLKGMSCDPDCVLLTLTEMLERFPQHPVNVELKDSVDTKDLDQLIDILDAHGGRPILVVSLDPLLLARFRKRCNGRYPTGFSALGVLGAIAGAWLPLNVFGNMEGNLALQTSHDGRVTKPGLIRKVHDRGGAVHVFLTRFTSKFPAIDAGDGHPTQAALFEVLDRGVDGVMTDRPRAVRGLIDAWLQQRATS